ncbi:hypothetical protein [Plantibacter sp. RU18]|uniref:hypothetical protein n=1 Tax=Plantibacter sp. RU18 TaxID=3158143 RepID=UPI003D36B7A0
MLSDRERVNGDLKRVLDHAAAQWPGVTYVICVHPVVAELLDTDELIQLCRNIEGGMSYEAFPTFHGREVVTSTRGPLRCHAGRLTRIRPYASGDRAEIADGYWVLLEPDAPAVVVVGSIDDVCATYCRREGSMPDDGGCHAGTQTWG